MFDLFGLVLVSSRVPKQDQEAVNVVLGFEKRNN